MIGFPRLVPLAAALAAAVASGCGGPPRAPGSAEIAPPPGPSEPPLRGALSSRGGAFSFRPCGAPATEGIAVTAADGDLAAAWRSLKPAADGELYVELRGPLAGGGRSMTVTDLVRAKLPEWRTLCGAPVFDGDFVVHGNEPSWSIEIHRDAIVYRSPEEPKGRRYPYSALRTDSGAMEYATKTESPRVSTLAAEIRPGRCVDTMSGEIRSFKAHVELDGKPLDGCAAAGVPPGGFGDDPLDELERYAGTYPSSVDLWSIEPWRGRLAKLLGAKLAAFRTAMQVAGPLSKDSGVYYALGNKPHAGGSDMAIFLADPDADALEVILFENGRRTDFKEDGRDVPPPPEARTFLENAEAARKP